jgi:hypothetical protein
VTTDADPEVAWLLDRERGVPAAPPSPALERAHERLAAALAGLPAVASEAGWQDRILAQIDAAPDAAPDAKPAAGGAPIPLRPRRAARWVALAAPALAAAAAVALWLGRDRAAPDAEPAALALAITDGAAPRRGGGVATVGDVLEATARPGAELLLYRGDHVLLVRCPGAAACRPGPAAAVAWPLTAPGRYRAFAITAAPGAAPLTPTGNLDADLAAAARAGAQVTAGAPVDVQ